MHEALKEQLRLLLRRQFGPRQEQMDIDQLGLFATTDDSNMITLSTQDVAGVDTSPERCSPTTAPAERKKAIRILKDLPRDIWIVDLPPSITA